MRFNVLIPEFVPKYMPPRDTLVEGILYISEEYGCTKHLCPCGCKQVIVCPIHPVFGWNLIKNSDSTVSLTPSIGNYQIPCRTHYYITNNKVVWL